MDFWDNRYSEQEYAYGIFPNNFFKDELLKVKPGNLLLPGEGEGRNAVFAASKGWNVTCFDQSLMAKTKALKLAEKMKVKITYYTDDYSSFQSETNFFDCIALIFTHMPYELRIKFHSYLIQLLKPGGKLIIEAFSKDQLNFDSGGPKDASLLYSKSDILNDFKMLKILKLEQQTVLLDEGKYHKGEASVIRCLASK